MYTQRGVIVHVCMLYRDVYGGILLVHKERGGDSQPQILWIDTYAIGIMRRTFTDETVIGGGLHI